MERALRVISVERGYDPADFTVVAFGGAGGLHVAELTERLGASKALIPPDPGLLSAYGMLASPVTREVSRTVLLDTGLPDLDQRLRVVLDELENGARDALISEGVAPEALVTERWIDARYQGQSFELGVPEEHWVQAFHKAHEERYGYNRMETPVEAVTLRVIVTGPPAELGESRIEAAGGSPPKETVRVAHGGEEHEAVSVWRTDLMACHQIRGPVIVQEYSGTTWVPPKWTLRVDDWGCLHLTPDAG